MTKSSQKSPEGPWSGPIEVSSGRQWPQYQNWPNLIKAQDRSKPRTLVQFWPDLNQNWPKIPELVRSWHRTWPGPRDAAKNRPGASQNRPIFDPILTKNRTVSANPTRADPSPEIKNGPRPDQNLAKIDPIFGQKWLKNRAGSITLTRSDSSPEIKNDPGPGQNLGPFWPQKRSKRAFLPQTWSDGLATCSFWTLTQKLHAVRPNELFAESKKFASKLKNCSFVALHILGFEYLFVKMSQFDSFWQKDTQTQRIGS